MIAIFICYFKIKSITVLHLAKTDSERYLNYRRHKNEKKKKKPKIVETSVQHEIRIFLFI